MNFALGQHFVTHTVPKILSTVPQVLNPLSPFVFHRQSKRRNLVVYRMLSLFCCFCSSNVCLVITIF